MRLRITLLTIAFGALLLVGSCVVEKANEAQGLPQSSNGPSGTSEVSQAQAEETRLGDKVDVRVPAAGNESVRIEKREQTKLPKLEKQLPRYIQGLLQTRIEAAPGEESVKFGISATNVSGRDLKLSFGSGHQFDLSVYNDRNEEVYSWANDKSFTQALIEMKLKKGKTISFEEEWNWIGNDGEAVPDGEYVVKLVLLAKVELPQDEQADPGQFTAETVLHVKREQS